jgi:hypothetical protein
MVIIWRVIHHRKQNINLYYRIHSLVNLFINEYKINNYYFTLKDLDSSLRWNDKWGLSSRKVVHKTFPCSFNLI